MTPQDTNVTSSDFDRLLGHSEAYNPQTGERMLFRCAKGAIVTDLEGRNYIDFNCGDGAITLGHADERVALAVQQTMTQRGCLVSGPGPEAGTVIELLSRYLPQEHRVSLFSSGSEAGLATLLGYRGKEEKPIVLSAGYHGWPTLWRPSNHPLEPNSHGVVDFFFDLDLLEEAIRKHDRKVGLVIFSPDHIWFDEHYYRRLFSILEQTDAVICCDDAMQGYRYQPGPSLPAWLNRLDVILMGKGLSNGARISAIASRPGAIPLLKSINSSVAYESLALAAAQATLTAYEMSPIHEEIRTRGGAFISRVRDLLLRTGAPIDLMGSGSTWQLVFADAEIEQAFTEACFVRGLLLASFDSQKPSHAIDEVLYDRAFSTIEEVTDELRDDSRFAEAANPDQRALAASYVLHGVANIDGLDKHAFIFNNMVPRTTLGGLIKDATSRRADTMWEDVQTLGSPVA